MQNLIIFPLLFFILTMFGCSQKKSSIPNKEQNLTQTKRVSKLPRVCFQPNTTSLQKILQEKKISRGVPLYIRIFKKEKYLELWGKTKEHFSLIKRYPICSFSGLLGPKQRSGDKQAPEGIYILTKKSLHPNSHYHLALNIQYPNRYDRNHRRTGSLIMIHGKCSSTGCFAMGNQQIEEIYQMVKEAFSHGQKFIYVSIYPFVMNQKNLQKFQNSYWYPFWQNLKTGYDMFEETHVPPFVGVKGLQYVFQRRGKNLTNN